MDWLPHFNRECGFFNLGGEDSNPNFMRTPFEWKDTLMCANLSL